MPAPSLTKGIKEKTSDAKPKDRVDLRLYNTIVIFDVYTIARSSEAAREAILAAIASGDAEVSEAVAKELTSSGSVRASWIEKTPFVAADVSDEEFETLKGITTREAFDRFYTKKPK